VVLSVGREGAACTAASLRIQLTYLPPQIYTEETPLLRNEYSYRKFEEKNYLHYGKNRPLTL
jgi:hypothetical protein